MRRSKTSLGLLLLTAVGLWYAGHKHSPHVAGDRQLQSDKLAIELRRFRAETDRVKRIDAIKRFGKVRDPRVTLALMEVVQEEKEMSGLLLIASSVLVEHHIPEEDWVLAKYWVVARLWWEKNETVVRQKAAILPQ